MSKTEKLKKELINLAIDHLEHGPVYGGQQLDTETINTMRDQLEHIWKCAYMSGQLDEAKSRIK